ncbi:sensor histidine kinase [Clostridium lacusfryxellense]|uniref:sensor histidine kinase n=1 Tax=Clostridium lacusfryxellense TaxID=205328 RepID=UPI001C0B08E5|nr:sensor histidine kinase [Clostridium lacusfryxellense]MBU3111288.1 sensor histidine kinase [Clostridium lacusfryxellense]
MTDYLKKLLGFNTIRGKLLLYSLLLIFIMISTSLYTLYNAKHILEKFDYMFINDMYLNNLSLDIQNIDEKLLSYLTTKSSDSLRDYTKISDSLRISSNKISRDVSYVNGELMLKDIGNMIDKYLDQGDAAIRSKRGRDVEECNLRYSESKEIVGYIDTYIKQLNLNQFHENAEKYFSITEKLKFLQTFNIVIIASTFLLNVVLTFWFANKTSAPIVSLATSANEMSRSNFDAENVKVDTDDELRVMADAFNKMKGHIRNHIGELKYQAETELKLKDEKLSNLKMKNLLKNAELKALQSQINPHFLFNTLNAGVQLAMMEGAEKTGVFLEKMSDLFRYNLRKMDTPVTLGEEIENVYAYIYLLKTRFGDLIKYEYYIDEEVIDIIMPSQIIQPIIENACNHGINDMECGGKICLRVKKVQDMVQVIIEDNGKGMDAKTIQEICDLNFEKPANKGRSTSIGMRNVIKRLKAFYGQDDVIEIKSEAFKGTSIILKLPLVKEEDVLV